MIFERAFSRSFHFKCSYFLMTLYWFNCWVDSVQLFVQCFVFVNFCLDLYGQSGKRIRPLPVDSLRLLNSGIAIRRDEPWLQPNNFRAHRGLRTSVRCIGNRSSAWTPLSTRIYPPLSRHNVGIPAGHCAGVSHRSKLCSLGRSSFQLYRNHSSDALSTLSMTMNYIQNKNVWY